MPHIGILFEVRRAETRPGETIGVVGNRPELGSWDPFDSAGALHLRTGAQQYPTWAMPKPVYIELGKDDALGFEDGSESDQDSEASQASTPGSPTGRDAEDSASGLLNSGSGLNGGDASIRVEYKYVRDNRHLHAAGPSIQWEDSIANRRVMIPKEHGSIWIVSDVRWNDTTEPILIRTTLAEVLERRGNLDPEWTIHRKDTDAPEWAGSQREETSSPGSAATSHHTTSTVCFL